jgi:predicted aspartyl protease
VPLTKCGFDDAPGSKGADMLGLIGPTLVVNIGFDPAYQPAQTAAPAAGISGVWALVDTGAAASCIDDQLANNLGLPVIDQKPISGTIGSHTANIYLAQVNVPALQRTIYGPFAGVHLVAGGQRHAALIGRTFLRYFKMTYNGLTGDVTIESEA